MRINGQTFEAVAHLDKQATARLMAQKLRQWLHLPVRVVPRRGQYVLMMPAQLSDAQSEAFDRAVGRVRN